MAQESENKVVAELARKFGEVDVIKLPELRQALSVPEGRRVQSIKGLLDEYRVRPERRVGTARSGNAESFAAMVNRSKGEASALFASGGSSPKVVAVIDYHDPGPELVHEDERARWCQHRIVYSFPVPDEWETWSAGDGQIMTQRDFAAFLEEHITDVIAPDQAGASAKGLLDLIGGKLATAGDLMTLSRGLDLTVKQTVKNTSNLSSGEASLLFESEHQDKAGKPLRVPSAFLLGIPVFEAGEVFQVLVRLRYRVSEGKVSWLYSMHRASAVFDVAFREACDAIQKATELPLYHGTPEGS